jgi:hypothetical protein
MVTLAGSATHRLQSRPKVATTDSGGEKAARQHVRPLEKEARNVKENRTNVFASLSRKMVCVRSQIVFTFIRFSAIPVA